MLQEVLAGKVVVLRSRCSHQPTVRVFRCGESGECVPESQRFCNGPTRNEALADARDLARALTETGWGASGEQLDGNWVELNLPPCQKCLQPREPKCSGPRIPRNEALIPAGLRRPNAGRGL